MQYIGPKRIFFVIFILILNTPVSTADVSTKVIAFACSGCHASHDPLSKQGIAKLMAQPMDDLERALLDFKYDRRASSIMGRIAKGYSDEELRAVAKYFSRLE